MKRIKLISGLYTLICVAGMLNTSALNAQVTASVVVLPPYSSSLEEYANKTRITITAMDYEGTEAFLHIRIIGDNGVELVSSIDMAYTTFTLHNAIPLVLTGADLDQYFRLQNLLVSGITPEEVRDQGLPPGNYRICAQVFTSAAGAVSGDEPAGCSNSFQVNYLQPPMLITPANDSKIDQTAVQHIIFSWTPSPGAPAWTTYTLKIVEMNDPEQDPNDAMLSATTPAFFEEEVHGTSFLYGPAQPLLDPGKRYAFEVIASDQENNTPFENNGRSEVYSFTYGEASRNIFSMVTETPATSNKSNVKTTQNAWSIPNSSLTGTLQYKFPQDLAKQGPVQYVKLKLETFYYILTPGNQKKYLENSLLDYQYKQKIIKNYGYYSTVFTVDFRPDTLPQMGSDFAYATTGNEGKYTFLFNNPGLGLVAKNITATRTQINLNGNVVHIEQGSGNVVYGTTQTTETITGDLYMYTRIIVDNPYYTSLDKDIIVQKGEFKNEGQDFVNVRAYDLKVNVKADKSYQNQYKQDNVEYMVVYVLRNYRPEGVPDNEGKGSLPVEPGEKKLNKFVVAKEITNNAGIAVIHDLVKNPYSDPGDQYYLYATALESSDINYTMDAAVSFKYTYYEDNAVYNPEYKLPSPDPVKELTAKPLPPAIKGSVYRYDNQTQPVAGANIKLYKNIKYNQEQNSTGTGNFNFDVGNSTDTDIYFLWITKSGFKFKFVEVPYNLVLGKKYVREDILLEPASTVTGTVVNEDGQGILVHIRMDDGAYEFFQPECNNFPIFSTGNLSANTTMNTGNTGSQGQSNSMPVLYMINSNNNSTGSQSNQNIVNKNFSVRNSGNPYTVNNNVNNINMQANSNLNIQPTCTKPTEFQLYAVTGQHKLIIDPTDPQYFNDTIDVDLKKDKNTIPPITIYRKKHRLKVRVIYYDTQGTLALPKSLNGAHVNVDNVGSSVTNSSGEAAFEYESSGDSVKIHIDGPVNSDFIPVVRSAAVKVSKDYKVITIVMQKGGRVKGTVYAGKTDSSAVAGAKVYADIPGEIQNQTTTDQNGHYELKYVPLNKKVTIRAVKSVSNYIGDSLQVVLSTNGVNNPQQPMIKENVDFHLTVYNDMDITKLLGFPVEVTKLTTGGAGGTDVYISGNFVNIPGNKYFKVLETETNPRFNNIPIVPSPYLKNDMGIPLSQPKNSKVTTNKNKLDVHVFDKYTGSLIGDQLLGLEVVDLTQGIGAVKGKVKFDESSLTTQTISFNEPVFLSAEGKPNQLSLTAFTNDPSYLNYPKGLHISDNTGSGLSFNMDALQMEADPLASFLNGDTMKLNTILHTNFKHVPNPDVKLPLGNLVFIKNAAQQVVFHPVSGKNLVIPLTQSTIPWSVNVNNWVLTESTGLLFKDGFVNTGMVTIPFTDIYIEHTMDSTYFKGGEYKLDELSLANIVTLTITGQKQFGYDQGRNCWKLSVSGLPGQPCAYFGGLPGMAQNDKVEIENFLFLSNNNPIFNIYQGTQPVTLYQVGSFYPGLITVINNEIGIAGMIDYHVPYLNNGNHLDYKIFYFKNQDGSIGFRNEVAHFLITPPGPVTMEFFQVSGTQKLDQNGFVGKGKVYETIGSDKLFEFDAWLYRTKDSTSLIVDKATNQMFRFTGNSGTSPRLENVYGRMYVSGGNWTNLLFGGDLKNANGASGPMSFIVQGDLVANKQKIAVTNVPGPFSNIANLTYDFENKRFTGSLDFNKTLAGGATFSASAEVLIDPTGWYFLGLGSINVPSPSMGGDASIFIGNYTINQYIINKFVPNSRVYQLFNEPPAGFPVAGQLFKGFYIEGGAHLPIPILPSFEFNLGLISASLSHEVGGDVRMSMDFNEADTYHMGVSIYGRITAGVGASMGLVCANSTVTGKGLISADGMYSTNGNWSATGGVDFDIEGSTELGVGACDSDCDGIFGIGPCIVNSEHAQIGLYGKFTISNQGTDFEFGFK